MSETRDPLTAPGVSEQMSERDRAIVVARVILRASNLKDSDVVLLARQFLRETGLTAG